MKGRLSNSQSTIADLLKANENDRVFDGLSEIGRLEVKPDQVISQSARISMLRAKASFKNG